MSDFAIVICVTVLIVLFSGEPDLMSKIIASFDPQVCQQDTRQ